MSLWINTGKHPYSRRLQMVIQWSLRISMDITVSLHEVQTDLLQNIWLDRAFSYFPVSGMSKLLRYLSLCCTDCNVFEAFERHIIAHLWFHHLNNIFSLRQFLSKQTHIASKRERSWAHFSHVMRQMIVFSQDSAEDVCGHGRCSCAWNCFV